jgi:hypothetical protein
MGLPGLGQNFGISLRASVHPEARDMWPTMGMIRLCVIPARVLLDIPGCQCARFRGVFIEIFRQWFFWPMRPGEFFPGIGLGSFPNVTMDGIDRAAVPLMRPGLRLDSEPE